MELEVGPGLVGNFLVLPCSDRMVADASLLERGDGEDYGLTIAVRLILPTDKIRTAKYV
jgi:hypothetical protein